jgi:hypothetical protein
VDGRFFQLLSFGENHSAEPFCGADARLRGTGCEIAGRGNWCRGQSDETNSGPEGKSADWTKLRIHGYTDEQILEAVAITALTNFLNTAQFGIGAVPDFEPRIAIPPASPKTANLLGPKDRPIHDSLAMLWPG